jgi:hypothetical protein
MARSQGEQLHEGCRLLRAPLLLTNGPGAHRNREATEQPDAHRLRYLARGWSWLHHAFKPSNKLACVLGLGANGSDFGCLFSYTADPCANGTISVFGCIQRQFTDNVAISKNKKVDEGSAPGTATLRGNFFICWPYPVHARLKSLG